MTMRLSGLMSGMDTESIVAQLVEARKAKVTTAVKAQKSIGFKQEVWKSLNTQILKLYDGALSNLRFSSSYIKKVTRVSNSSVASVITSDSAMNSVQELTVNKMARSAYLTGGKMELQPGAESETITGDTKLREIGFDLPLGNNGTIKVTVGGEEKEITVNRATTLSEFVSELKSAGVNANLDTVNGRIYVAGTSTGADSNFKITAKDANGKDALNYLGLNYDTVTDEKQEVLGHLQALVANADSYLPEFKQALEEKGIDVSKLTIDNLDEDTLTKINNIIGEGFAGDTVGELSILQGRISNLMDDLQYSDSTKVEGEDAEITLNGVTYTSSKNTFEINGLTITATSVGYTNLTTEDDTDGIYDMIKNFFNEYNELINQMDKLYNAESASDYEPLTDEEKAEMSDSAVEQWEQKIKDSILRRDTSLNSIASAMKQIMMEGVEVNGKKMYLSNFGIETLSYFTAAENEKNAYHIDGNSDDANTSGNADKLKSMIATDPDTVVEFFTNLSKALYGKMTELMAGTEYSSAYTAYDDKKMKTEYDDYTTKIKELEQKLADYEDQWYAKFAAMETAMAKMQSNASAVTALLGGS